MKIRKLAAVLASAAVASALAVGASAETAGIMFKTNNWAHRNSLNQSTAMYAVGEDGDMEAVPGWKAGDVTIDKDGQYTATIEFSAMEDAKDGVDEFWRVLKLETNIEANENINVTIDKLTVDGKEVAGASAAVKMEGKSERSDDYDDQELIDYTKDYINIELYNEWNSDSKYIQSSDYGRKVEITFTVSGMGGDNANTGSDISADGDTEKPTDDKNSPNTGVEGVAVIAGLAVIAAGAVVVAKKRK